MQRGNSDSTPASWQTEETQFNGGTEPDGNGHFTVREGVCALDALENASCALTAANAVLDSIARESVNGEAVKPEMVFALQRLQLQAQALVDSVKTGYAA